MFDVSYEYVLLETHYSKIEGKENVAGFPKDFIPVCMPSAGIEERVDGI